MDKFSYQGRLVFNGLYTAEIDSETSPRRVLNSLPEYEEGTPKSPSTGFKEIELTPDQGERVSIENSLLGVRYKNEEFSRITALDEAGEEVKVYDRRLKTGSVFWIDENFLFIKASADLEPKLEASFEATAPRVSLNKITFGSDFLFWLIYQYFGRVAKSSRVQ